MAQSLLDGLGGEELTVSGTNLNTQHIFVTGSITATSQYSGAQIFSTGSVTGARITDANGLIASVTHGSPGLFGAIINVGSFATSAGSLATVQFRRNFTTANSYVFLAWPQSGMAWTGTLAGSMNVIASGTSNSGKQTGSINVVGAASVVYDYFAVGL